MFPTIAEYNQTIQKNGGQAFVTLNYLRFIPSRTVPVRIFNYGAGSYAVIFKAKDISNTYAIRCFLNIEQETIYRYKEISNHLKNVCVSFLSDLTLFENEINVNSQYYPVLKMDWIGGKLLNNYIDEMLYNNQLLKDLQNEIVWLSKCLEENQIGHGDIQCGNIIIQTTEKNKPIIKLIDYDGMYVPALRNKHNLERGRTEFQHPQRVMADFDEKIDRFSFWVILCALEALKFDKSLWKEVMQGGFNTLDNMLFVGSDFTNFNNSKLVNRLYALHQPSVSYYLDKLKKFCTSTPSSVEIPTLYGLIESKVQIPIVIEKPLLINNEPEKKKDMLEITSNPSGAYVLTADHQRLGVTPLQIDKQRYLNQILTIASGIKFKTIQINQNDTTIAVSFIQTSVSAQPPSPPSSPPTPQSPMFHVVIGGVQQGPFGVTQMQQMAQTGQLTPQTLVWCAGMSSWDVAGTAPLLTGIFGVASPPPLSPSPSSQNHISSSLSLPNTSPKKKSISAQPSGSKSSKTNFVLKTSIAIVIFLVVVELIYIFLLI